MITLENVVKDYGDGACIGPLNLSIPEGGVTVLVGPNGAGKSTTLTIMGRLLTPDSGVVTVAGEDVSKVPSAELAKTLSILRQENHFVTRLTVRELVGFGRFPHSHGRLTREDQRQISDAIEFLNLGGLEHRLLDELSGGQRQRAYVAMVLAQDTDYVLLDEPLNNLDMQHSVQMMRRLRKAADELGKTVVIVLHDINFACRYADYIVALRDGQVAVSGTPDELLQPGVLSDVFGTPVTVTEAPCGPVAVYY